MLVMMELSRLLEVEYHVLLIVFLALLMTVNS